MIELYVYELNLDTLSQNLEDNSNLKTVYFEASYMKVMISKNKN